MNRHFLGEGKSVWICLRWTVSLDRHSTWKESRVDSATCGPPHRTVTSPGKNIGLTTPQVDRLFGRSLSWEGKSSWYRLWWIDGLFGPSPPWRKRWLDYATAGWTLWTVTFRGRRRPWLGLRLIRSLDRRFSRRKLSLNASEGSILSTVTSQWRKSAWPSLRWMDSLDRHFPVKECQPDLASGGSTLWTVTSREGKSACPWLRLRLICSLDRQFPGKERRLT